MSNLHFGTILPAN